MNLNTLRPADGAHKSSKRVGRGTSSGKGKTCGRGHKGQKARSGGKVPIGFEGGQMPLQRRLPKSGFNSRVNRHFEEIRTSELNKLSDRVTLQTLHAAGLIKRNICKAKVFMSGPINKALTVAAEIRLTKGAKQAIETAGGKVEE